MSRPVKGVTDADRILSKITVDEATECWEWQGYRLSAGHGRVRANGRKVLVHRWVFEHLVGPIPEGLELDHLCRNPPCCNPDHLEPVDHRTNCLRGVGQGALNAAKVACPKGHRYDDANTLIDGLGRRVCRTCRQAWVRRSNARRRPQSARSTAPRAPETAALAAPGQPDPTSSSAQSDALAAVI